MAQLPNQQSSHYVETSAIDRHYSLGVSLQNDLWPVCHSSPLQGNQNTAASPQKDFQDHADTGRRVPLETQD